MPTDHAEPAVRAIQLENDELRRKVLELRIQMNCVLSFLDIKNVAEVIKNNHTDPAQRSTNEHNTKSFSEMVISTVLKSNKSDDDSPSSCSATKTATGPVLASDVRAAVLTVFHNDPKAKEREGKETSS